MKRIEQLGCIALLALTLTSCSQKKKTDDIITQKVETPKPQAPIRMQEYKQQQEVLWQGRQYKVEITRVADDSLRMVKDESGQQFVDNRIELVVRQDNGKVFFTKRFTKAAFEPYLDKDYRQTGILEGFVYSGVNGSDLEFAASISHPQTDEYIPLVVLVSRSGKVSVSLDTKMDTEPEEEQSEPSESSTDQ